MIKNNTTMIKKVFFVRYKFINGGLTLLFWATDIPFIIKIVHKKLWTTVAQAFLNKIEYRALKPFLQNYVT